MQENLENSKTIFVRLNNNSNDLLLVNIYTDNHKYIFTVLKKG